MDQYEALQSRPRGLAYTSEKYVFLYLKKNPKNSTKTNAGGDFSTTRQKSFFGNYMRENSVHQCGVVV